MWGLRPPRSSQRSLYVAAEAASFNSLAHWASASLLPPLAALGSRSSQRSLRVAAKAASFNSLAHWASASLLPPLAALGSRSSQRSLRVAAKAASFNSLAHWASASLLPPLAALGSAPLPLLKKAGENQLENFSGFPPEYAGPPRIRSGGLGWFEGSRGGKGWWMDRLGGGIFQRSGRGGGRAQRAQSRGGPLAPPLLWFCGPFGPAKRRRPAGMTPTLPPSPTPACFRRPYGGCPGGSRNAGAPHRRGGGAAGLRPAAGPLPGIARQRPGGRCPPAAPPRTATLPPSPAPARFRRPYGDRPGAQEGRGGPAGGGGVWRPWGGPAGRPTACQTKERDPGAKGPGPRSFRALRAQPPPPRRGFHQRQNGSAKVLPFAQPCPAPSTARKRW